MFSRIKLCDDNLHDTTIATWIWILLRTIPLVVFIPMAVIWEKLMPDFNVWTIIWVSAGIGFIVQFILLGLFVYERNRQEKAILKGHHDRLTAMQLETIKIIDRISEKLNKRDR